MNQTASNFNPSNQRMSTILPHSTRHSKVHHSIAFSTTANTPGESLPFVKNMAETIDDFSAHKLISTPDATINALRLKYKKKKKEMKESSRYRQSI